MMEDDEVDRHLHRAGETWREQNRPDRPIEQFVGRIDIPEIVHPRRSARAALVVAAVAVLTAAAIYIPITLAGQRGPGRGTSVAGPSTEQTEQASSPTVHVASSSQLNGESLGTTPPSPSGSASNSSTPPLRCPSTVSAPFTGSLSLTSDIPAPRVPSNGHLLPDEVPIAAIVCAYSFVDVGTLDSQKDVSLEGDLSAIAALSSIEPIPTGTTLGCTANLPSRSTIYLLGVQYESGSDWLRTIYSAGLGGNCLDVTSNGTSAAYPGIASILASAMTDASWPPGTPLPTLPVITQNAG